MAATNIKRANGDGHTVLEQYGGAIVVDPQALAAQREAEVEARVALSHGAQDWYPESWLPEVKHEA